MSSRSRSRRNWTRRGRPSGEYELGASPTEWLFDPTDVEREEVGLRSLLAGVEALESDI
jgi:hypothetical protein